MGFQDSVDGRSPAFIYDLFKTPLLWTLVGGFLVRTSCILIILTAGCSRASTMHASLLWVSRILSRTMGMLHNSTLAIPMVSDSYVRDEKQVAWV